MPREVSDIKQFIEISRRKDASCTLTTETFALFNDIMIDGTNR